VRSPIATLEEPPPAIYEWIEAIHPGIHAVNARFPGINYKIAPIAGFGIECFVAEAKEGRSTWDVYIGQTHFVEMSAFIKAGAIEPWDPYIPKDVIDDILPSIRQECTVDGKLCGWPFLLDVIRSTSWASRVCVHGRWRMMSQRLSVGYTASICSKAKTVGFS
jgi:hypothetical protein